MSSKNYKECIILEQCTVARPSDIYIMEEQKINIGDKAVNKIFFRTRLQSANEKNGNGRFYSNAVINEIVDSLSGKAKNRSLFQEIDHPFVATTSSDDSNFKKRAVITELKNCGSLIRNIYTEGNDVIAEIETLSGFKGPDLSNLIAVDKANIGFSLRMFGRLRPSESMAGVMEVCTPLKAITYDVVSNPSHSTARVMNFLTESESESYSFLNESEDNYVTESFDELILEGSDVCLPSGCKEECDKYLMTLLQESFNNIKPFKFKY